MSGYKPRALLSVLDKREIATIACGLIERGFEVISTGGTAKEIQKVGLPSVEVSDVTGFPEGLDGRVKILHPNIFAGILALQSNDSHRDYLNEHGIKPFHVVVVNPYDFVGAVAKPGATFDSVVENIDIGGPSAIRAAAKNYRYCLPVVDPDDYPLVLRELDVHGVPNFSEAFRRKMQRKVFEMTARYDTLIAAYLAFEDAKPEHLIVTQ